jgi:hypothetical protein
MQQGADRTAPQKPGGQRPGLQSAVSTAYFVLIREMRDAYNHRLRLVESARQRQRSFSRKKPCTPRNKPLDACGSGVAKVAIARKLAVRMYWMLRNPANYAQLVRMQGSPRGTLVGQ